MYRTQSLNKSWARVIRKTFKSLLRHEILILQPWYWKLMKNTWSIEHKILVEKLEIQARKKVRFLRRNDKLAQIENFKALKVNFWTKIGIIPQCAKW